LPITDRQGSVVLRILVRQARGLASLLAALYVPAAALLLGAVVTACVRGVTLGMFTRDPTTIMGASPLIGALSSIGVLAWCATATLCLFTWAVMRHRTGGRLGDTFLLTPGLLTTALTLDDLFEIHETLIPHYVGGPDDLLIVPYVLIAMGWVIAFHRRILETDYVLLLIAIFLLAVSVAVDALTEGPYSTRYMFEDGFKFLGIVGWLGYLGRVCFRELTGAVSGARAQSTSSR
jgi:hypothetical protein